MRKCARRATFENKSVFIKNEEESKRAYPYTVAGAIETSKGVTDDTGYEVRPLKFDSYSVWTIAVFVVLAVVLAYIQTF